MRLVFASMAAFAALSACAQDDNATETATPAPEQVSAAPDSAPAEEDDAMAATDDGGCPVIDSRNWTGWVNAMPGPNAEAKLYVEGEIDLPTPGYTVTFAEGAADRSATPTQRLILSATAPADMVAQVVTTEKVRYVGPAISRTYKSVIVTCGGEPLAEIIDIILAQ